MNREAEELHGEGLISYAHLEKIPNKIEGQSYDHSTFDQMPATDALFCDLSTGKTFENIPSDVFDQIPRAVTAREEKRLIKFQERLLLQQQRRAEEDSTSQQEDSSTPKVSTPTAIL